MEQNEYGNWQNPYETGSAPTYRQYTVREEYGAGEPYLSYPCYQKTVPNLAAQAPVDDRPQGSARTLGKVAMILGIVSVAGSFEFFIIGLACGITALILGIISLHRHKTKNNQAVLGIVLGSVGICMGMMFLLFGLFILGSAFSESWNSGGLSRFLEW